MTSTNDGKDVKSIQTSAPKGKKYHIELYKSLEARLSSEDSLEARTGHVCDAWRRVYSLHQHSAPSTHPHLLSWLQRHTALTILQSEWQSSPIKDELHARLSAAIDSLVCEARGGELPWQRQLVARARWFRAALASPWGHPVLASLLNDPGEPLADAQVLEWLKEERGVVFVSRLRQLAASRRTDDLALALAGAVMDRARAARAPPRDDAPDDAAEAQEDSTSFYALLRRDAGFLEVWDLLTDIEFVLLHKREKRAKCIELAKQTPLRDGYHLVERLRSRLETAPRDKKLWKNAKEVATLIAQVIIARCMVLATCSGAGRTALYCCARSLARLVPPARLPAVTAALAAPAATARHLHTLCSAIHAQCAGDMKPFVCELYVRAITAGMNELERLKLNADKQAEARASEQTLASWFTQLGALLGASARLRAECALTAFSVHPAPELYERVRHARLPATVAEPRPERPAEAGSEFGSWANDSRTQSNLVKTSQTLQMKRPARHANVLSSAILTEGEALGLPPELGQDLAVLLAGPRVKTLAWDMDRELLLQNCRAHMERTHGGTRALTTELKYLNLDPSAFQHLPEEEDDENDAYYGIEKGYEHLVQLEEPEGIWQSAFFDPEQTESAAESEREERARASSADEDPLSLLAHANKQRKQARNEKSETKHRKKSAKHHGGDGSRERKKDKQTKTKKERKKKSDATPADLGAGEPAKIKDGEKRARKKKERRRDDAYTNISVTDSDYDSRGKASQVSDNNDPSVLFDGLFSMDEMKSPERRKSSEKPQDGSSSIINSSSPTVISKIINAPNPAINKTVLETVKKPTKLKSSAGSDSDVSRSRSPYLTPNQLINRHLVNDKVKKSITKLLQFRRQKNASSSKNPVASGQKSDNTAPAPVSTQPTSKHNEAPKVYLDKKQTQQLEAINNLLNVANGIKNSEQVHKMPYEESAKEYDDRLTCPQNTYNIQKQQEAMQCMSQNIVQNPNVFSDNRNTCSDYMQSSPHKQSPHINYLSNHPARSCSAIDASYLSPSKQAEKYYGLNVTPPKPESKISRPTFHKSMQNLAQTDSTKFNPPPKQLNEPRYYNQYTNNKLHDSHRLPNSSAKSTSHSQIPSNSHSSIQQQYAAMNKPRGDYVKSYQPGTDNRINASRSSLHNSKQYSSPKQLSSSMQNIHSDIHGTVSDVSRTFSAPRGPANHANTQSMSSHNDLSNAQHDTVSTDAKPDSRHNPTQYPKDKLVSNVPAKPQHVKSTPQSSEAESHTKFKDFLKELQDTINAGVSDYGSYQPINLNKQVQVTPMTPLDRPSTPNNVPNAKQTKPSKKNETAPNTFSRLSYLHKNKQSEIKSRNDSNAVNAELKSLNMNILEHKMSKAKYMKHEVTISRVPKPADSSGNVLCNLQKKNPVLSSILSSMSAETYKRPSQPGVVANSQNTSDNMTNREHADLLLLLRNQQTLKVPNNQTRVPEQNVSNKLTKSETQVPATYQRLHDNYEVPPINKKVDPAVGHNPQVAKESTKTDDDKQQDWETVMNAIRAHKTQPLGPNALEMVLKKDKKQLPSNSKSDINLKQTPLSSSSAPNNEPRKRDNQSSRSNSSALKPSLEKHGGVPKNQTEVIKKIPQVEMLKKTPQVEMPKKSEAPNKHFATNSLKRDDPFISGIPNSDYDLLEELMDDDLRQEIGELSSDEERYHAPTVMKVKRSALGSVSKVNNHVCAKVENPPKAKPHVADQKTIACKNAPNLNVPDFKCTRTTMNASSSTGYAKVIENPVLPEATSLPQNRPTVLCSNIESSHMAANIITNQSENHFIPNIAASNHIEPANLIFTSIPAQPMMLISQELVYDPYPTIRIHESQVSAGLCNVTPHAFVTLNPTPNIAVYQTTQFAAPVINPVIIGNAMTTTTNVTNTTEYQQPKPNLDKQESQPPIINSTNPVPDNLTNYSDTTADRPLHSDINMNKCSDRKVLSQMQDNNTIDNSEKDGRIRRKSLDNTSLKTKQDEERIKMKRQALMNREVNHSCFHPPIPLSYTPLREKRNLDKLIQQATPKNGAVKSTFKLRSSSTVVTKDVAANASVEIPKSKTNNENLDSSDMASSSKENQKCRRILLRSLSKLDSEIAPSKVGRVPLRRNKFKPKRTQASEKIDTHGPSVNNDKIKTDTKTPTRASIRIMNKAIATVDTTGSSSIINSGIHQDTKKKEESSEVKLNSDSGAIDFENAITGSVILTTSSDLKREVVSEIKLNKDNMAKEKTQQLLRDDKVAQISNEKPAILKETKLISGSATSSIQPDKVLEKPKSNLVVKSSVTSPASANKPIVMTIKNQNQAILSNESITTYTKERISSPACNKMTKSDVKEVKLEKTPSKAESTINKINASKPIVAKSVAKDTEAKLEIATSKSESTVSNIMNAPKPPATQNIVKNTEAKLEIAIPTSESTVTDTIAAVTPSVTRSIAKNSEAKLVSAPSKSTLTSEINVSNPPFDENDDHKKARHVNPKQNLRKVQQKDESGNQNNADDLPHKRSLGSAAPQQTRQQAVPVKVKSSANNRSLLLPVNKPLEDQKGNNNVIFLDSAILSEEKQTDSHSAKRFDVVNTVQNPETPVVGTDTTRPKKAIAKDNSTVGNSSLPKMDTQKTTDLATKNKNSQETCNNVNKNAPQYRQEDVIIEEVPITGDEDPAKKSVRITLPNGKIYKATVFGKMNIDCNTLFTDPAMKSIMTERLLEGKRYTLNINQISKASKDNPTKILDQKFCKINIKEKEIPVETVNLISDDEDDDVHSFSTEFGKFRTNINIEELNKHQRKFDQRCTVKLKRDDIFKSNRTKPKPKSFPSTPTSLLTRNKSKLASEVQNSHVKSPQVQATPIEAEDDLPPVYLNCNKVSNNDQHTRSSLLLNKDATPQENIPEIIEIDDSSSDSESKTSLNCTEPTLEPVKKIIELKNLLLKDLGVDDKNKGKPITIPIEQQVTVAEDLKSALLQDLGVAIAPPNSQEKKENSITIESKDKVDEPVHTLKKYNIKNCVVKLPTCDDLIKKFELMKNAKNCVVILQRYNYSPDVTRVIESDNSETAESNLDCNEDYIDFDVEETCSPQLSRCPSLSILNNLWDETHETENIYGRSSPVMEIFDVLVSLRNKIENTVEIDRHVENHKIWICDSEWTMTKQACRIQEIFEISYIKDTKRISLVCNDSVERPEAFTPPKLITIAFKFLEDNPDVVYRLHSIREVKKKTSLNHLKRKTEHLVDNNVACKILKLGTLVIRALNSYTKNVDKKSIVRCHDEKKHMKTDVILNEQKVSYQKRLSITEQYSFCQDYIVPNVENSECNEQNERTDDQCVNDSDLVPSNIEMDKTAENLEKTEENSVINIDESSEVSNGVISKDITECSSVNVSNVVSTVDEPEETGKEASIGPEPESVLHTEDVVAEVKASLPKNSGAIECELFGSYENAIDTEKVLSPVRICDDPNKINECPITLPQIEPMGSCNSLECQEKPFTVQTVIKPDNIHNKEVNVMTDTITVTKNKQSNELINFSPATADNENNDNPMNENVLTDDYDTDINKSIGDNAVPCENVNEKSTENNVTATNGTNTDRPNIEGPEVSSITVKDDSVNISIDRPQYETAIAVNNNDSETTQRNVSINLDGSETECNENVNAENTSQKCAALCSYDTVSFTVYCCNDLVNIEKTEQNLTTNKSVSPDIDIDPRISKLTSRSEEEMNEKALNAPLVEIPISDMPHEVYEVEIRDTNLEDDGEIQNSDAINLQSIPTSIDTSVKTNGCDSDITSPIFVDNKEIIFNYHDYTKLPKVKLAKIHDEITNAQSLTLNEGLKSTEDGNNYNNNETTVKVVNPIITTKPERKYELIQEDDWLTVITTEHDNESTADIDSGSSHVQPRDNVEDTKIVTIPDTEKAGVTLNGIEIEDPVIGTSGSSESNIPTESIENNGNTNEGATVYSNLHDAEFCVIAPKITYSKGNLKRKMDMRDHKLAAKKYRKGKNIDCSKQTVRSIIESAYSKEYKRLLEYCSSVKFSYNRPFHKECVDVADMTADWPIKTTCTDVPEDGPDVNLFIDVQTTPPYQPDPTTQTLVEEITHDYEKTDGFQDSASVEAYETNFDMGFGEGSGRVIQNLKKGGDSNISAATLSDVKQTQPVFMSEGQDNCAELSNSIKDDQIKKIRQYVSFIELRDKVRSFFKKSSSELKLELMQQNIKECGLKSRYGDRNISADFPYDLCSLEYVKPIPTETIVQVVQLGQLPVSAAAQNPVTCDPRVTQVSDASPSQCSVDNSPNDDSQSEIKTEYTELTTADLTLPLVQEYAQQNQAMNLDSHDADKLEFTEQTISLEMEIKAEETPEIKEELPDIKEEGGNSLDNADLHTLTNATPENIEYLYDNNTVKADSNNLYDSSEQNSCEALLQQRQQNGSTEKTDQIAHAMTAAGITTMSESMNNSRAHALVNIISQKIRQGSVNTTQTTTNTYSKTTSINAMSLQQALAQILPPPLNQTGTSENNQPPSAPVGPQVLHIVQGKNASGNQITLLDNSQQSVISTPNATQVLHIVQNKGATAGQTSNGALAQQPNSFSGLSLVDTGLQQGGNQLLHIVNTGNQKNANAGQLLKRVNLLTNLANVQGSNEQKMVQFVCKSADGKAIQLNAPHQRGMVLRLQPIETSNVQTPQAKPAESQELSTSPTNSACNKETASQQEIKSRSIYEENYAKFIQNSSSKTPNSEKSTSLPKFNQAFGKAVFQEGNQKQAEGSSPNSHLQPTNTHTENSECPPTDNAINLEAMRQIGSPPLLIRKPPVTTQSQPNIVQQIKQTIAPMNIQTMHGGVIYTRQIPVNIGGGQTINLITVPSTELINDESSKTQAGNQGEGEPSIIKIVPQNQNTTNAESSQEENNGHVSGTNDAPPTPQPQPVLTQMRIKLPMLSKAPQMVPGARVVRPSFFQIQRNVIGGANQPVYQQLVLTAAPPLGQQTIRLPQAQASRPIKVPSENQSSSESQMSTSTLEQLREFDMVLEQVKERSTVQPGTNSSNNFKLQNNSSDATDGTGSSNCSSESTQILYSIGNNHSLNVAYVNRKATVTTPTTSTFVRSPDSTGVADSPTSSTHSHIPHTVTSDSSPTDMTSQSKPAKVCSKSKSRPKSSSNPPNTLKLNSVPPKTSSQKPLEDEQTTQRILYILAEYKEQVENSPDKDKPAPRRRSNPPSNPGSSKRKKSSSSRRSGTRDASPVHGEDTCRTMGSEDSSCGTSQGDCNESCLDSHSPQDSPRKVARKITFDQEQPAAQPRQPQRNVIVADGQTITVARSATGKPATAVLMPTNYILPVSMMKGGQQIAIVTNRGPKLLTVGGEAGAANALLLQRLIGPGGLKPVLARPGVRHVRLPATALHNLQAFNLAATAQPPDSSAAASPAPAPPEPADARAADSPWADRDDVKPERGSSPEGSEPWNLPSSADAHEYSYEETVRTDSMERTVLDPVPGRYSPDMEAQRIFDKMFDVEKKSYVDSPRCAYDIDATDGDDKAYQVVQKKDGTHRQHRLSHVSAAALRHKYAILEHELRLQKSLSEECEDLGVDSPSASELFPEAELLFAASPAHEHAHDAHDHAPAPHQSAVPPAELDEPLPEQLLPLGDDAQLDPEEFARAHPNTTFHSEPDEVQPFTITGLKGRHITSTIFHSNGAPATVLMAAPAAVHERARLEARAEPGKDGLRFDAILADARDLRLHAPAAHAAHAAHVIRRVCYEDDKRERDARYLIDEPDSVIAGDDAEMVAEDDSRDAAPGPVADADDAGSSPERHAELFWESASTTRSEGRRPPDFSSDSDKCCKSPFDENNSTDSSGGAPARLDTVIKAARGGERGGSAGSDDAPPPLRTYPPKRLFHAEGESVSGKTRAGEAADGAESRRRASARGVVKRGCHCCGGEPPARVKKPRQRKPALDFAD